MKNLMEARTGPGRIAVLAHTHPSITRGGAELAAYSLFVGLKELGHEVIFVSACPYKDRNRLSIGSPDEIPIFYKEEWYEHFFHLGRPVIQQDVLKVLQSERIVTVNFHHFLNFGINVIRETAEQGFNTFLTLHEYLLICYNHGQMVKTQSRQPLCESPSDRQCVECFPEYSDNKFLVRRRLFSDALSQVKRFISPSVFLANKISRWGIEARRMCVIENGLRTPDESYAVRRDNSRRPDRGSQRWIYGFFGQITPFKGVGTVLDAATQIADDAEFAAGIEIRIYGEFIGQPKEFMDKLKRTSEKCSFVRYMGPYSNENVGELMQDCEYVLVPSSWWENSPLVIQEAFRAGRPVICSGVGGMAEKVRDGESGIHFKISDPGDLVRALRLAANGQMHKKLRARLPKPRDQQDMARAYLAEFEAAVRENGHAGN
jgi:glycosyltransferase involved in cell wall biosynthesis